MRVALRQFRAAKGDVAANVAKVRESLACDADVTVFPETALSGYFVEGAAREVSLTTLELTRVLGPPPPDRAPDVALGLYERDDRGVYNSVAYLTPGAGPNRRYEVVHVHRKVCLATYGVFQEARFVQPGREVRAFDTRFGRVGMLACEDLTHSLTAAALALDGARAIYCACASPARNFRPGSPLPANLVEWDRIAGRTAHEHGVFVFLAQLLGSEGGRLLAGGSSAWGPEGTLLGRAPLFADSGLEVEMDPAAVGRARAKLPLLADLETALPRLLPSLDRARRPGAAGGFQAPGSPSSASGGAAVDCGAAAAARERPGPDAPAPGSRPSAKDDAALAIDCALVEAALLEFLRDEVARARGFRRVVVGVSGGVDSAVSLYLAAKALGPDNVFAFRLPYATSSPESLTDARAAIEAAGARERTISIADAVDGYVEAHEPDATPLRRGNVAARTRATVLFDQAAKLNALPLGTGNKSERLLGYYTWHADDSPPVNPLGDLFKTQVRALAEHLGVPRAIVEKPPSADLVQGVDDEDELGVSYRVADPILRLLIEGRGPESLVRSGFRAEDVDAVQRRLSSTHWKRALPTTALLSTSGIGAWYLRPVDY